MSKKKFAWVRDDDEPLKESPYRPTRRDKQEEVERTDELMVRIVALRPDERESMGFGEDLIQALAILDGIRANKHGAIKRQRMRISSLLRATDLDLVEERIADVDRGRAERDDLLEALVRWRTRLIEGGDEALQQLLEEYPDADRQRLRSLSAAGRKDSAKARRSLMDELKAMAGV